MKIEINSKDSFGENYSKIFKVNNINETDKEKLYEYEDEFVKTKIIIKNNVLEIYRNGKICSKQVFKKGLSTSFFYVVENLNGHYEIFTRELEITENKINVEYDIILEKEKLNTISLNIIFHV